MQKREIFLWCTLAFLFINVIFLYYIQIQVAGETGIAINHVQENMNNRFEKTNNNINACSSDENCSDIFALKGYSCEEELSGLYDSSETPYADCYQGFCTCKVLDEEGKSTYRGTGFSTQTNIGNSLLVWKMELKK